MTETEFGPLHRVELLLGGEAVRRLQQSFVMIAGLGAVGGFTLEALARMGVGRFRLIDCDVIQPSNFNRQILADTTTTGRKKIEVAAERIHRIRPKCRIETLDRLINAASIPELFQFDDRPPDLVIDGIDSLGPKVELLVAAQEQKIPVISSMGAALRTDPSRIRFGPMTEVTGCPLSAMLRKRLRRRGVSTDDIPVVYSTEAVRDPRQNGHRNGAILPPEMSEEEKPLGGRRRSTLGSLPTVTGIFGLWLAHYAMNFLTTPRDAEP